ncbi:MAG: MFS transporter [Magnetovibrio sp.]|nr:MFS transporter [Magnetovibrio sp.]
MSRKYYSITMLIVSVVLTISLWFATTAVVPSLVLLYEFSETRISMFTSAMQLGFVIGTLISAFLGLADIFDPRRFFFISSLTAASINYSLLFVHPTSDWVLLARLGIGVCMAGVYPVGIKIAATWAEKDLGWLVGILIAAMAFGSAVPHLFNAFTFLDWRKTIAFASFTAILGSLVINAVKLGPRSKLTATFSPKIALISFKDPALRLANFGYLGHMWELYAMWTWIGVFLDLSFRLVNTFEEPIITARLVTFLVIGVGGALGCILGGYIADRLGRTAFLIGTMVTSGLCTLTVGFLFGGNPYLLTIICFIWGISIVADSAQFSSSITELAPLDHVGTMLTMQTCCGFLLTLISVHMVPIMVTWCGWEKAFMFLAIGPFLGAVAISRLRVRPEAQKLANGRR